LVLGAIAVLLKPLQAEMFIATLRRALDLDAREEADA
jgi:hypothetical protein